MHTFKVFTLLEKASSTSHLMSLSGSKGRRHAINYVLPHVGSKTPLELGRDHGDLKSGSKVHVVKQHEVDGKHHTEVVHKGIHHTIPNSKFVKPAHLVKRRGDRGFAAESHLVKKLKEHGLMKHSAEAAGSTGGNDFHIDTGHHHIKGKEKKHINHELQGESKIDLGAKFGSVFLSHNKEKGWHVSDKAKSNKPEFAKAVEKAKVGGKPLLHHLNHHWGEEKKGKHLPNVTSDTTNHEPATAYLKDHHVHVLHIHSHGTYRGGHSHHKDVHSTGLPNVGSMTGRFTVGRERRDGGVQISFRPHKKTLDKSHVDIMTDDGINHLKHHLAKTKGSKK